jgi:drug/metabolite transporter (DMT)-like permease
MSYSNLSSPGLSLSAAVSWGAADFSGGIASKTSNAFRVVLVAHATGLVFMLSLALLRREPIPDWSSILWGAVAGLVGGIGLAAFYKSLAVGTMGINASLSAVITALVPLLFSFRTEGLPDGIRLVGFALAMISIWVMSAQRGSSSQRKGLGLAVIAGLGFGGFLLFMKLGGSQAVFWPLVSARSASFLLMLAIVLLSGGQWTLNRSSVSYMLAAGILDSSANALYVGATQRGRLDVAAVLSSLYPVSTILLARLVLKERLSGLQSTGIVVALVAVSLIAVK